MQVVDMICFLSFVKIFVLFHFNIGSSQECNGCTQTSEENCTELVDNNVYACRGTWSIPGMLSTGSNTASELCAPGYEICPSAYRVNELGLTSDICGSSLYFNNNEFFASKQSGSGYGVCDNIGSNDIFGCTQSNSSNNVVNIGYTKKYFPGCNNTFSGIIGVFSVSWSSNAWSFSENDSENELNNVILSDSAYGGVLCCNMETSNSTITPTNSPTSTSTTTITTTQTISPINSKMITTTIDPIGVTPESSASYPSTETFRNIENISEYNMYNSTMSLVSNDDVKKHWMNITRVMLIVGCIFAICIINILCICIIKQIRYHHNFIQKRKQSRIKRNIVNSKSNTNEQSYNIGQSKLNDFLSIDIEPSKESKDSNSTTISESNSKDYTINIDNINHVNNDNINEVNNDNNEDTEMKQLSFQLPQSPQSVSQPGLVQIPELNENNDTPIGEKSYVLTFKSRSDILTNSDFSYQFEGVTRSKMSESRTINPTILPVTPKQKLINIRNQKFEEKNPNKNSFDETLCNAVFGVENIVMNDIIDDIETNQGFSDDDNGDRNNDNEDNDNNDNDSDEKNDDSNQSFGKQLENKVMVSEQVMIDDIVDHMVTSK